MFEGRVTGCRVDDVDKFCLVVAHGAQGDGDMSGEHMPPQSFSARWGGLQAHALNHIPENVNYLNPLPE
jgi:hypothetical protein